MGREAKIEAQLADARGACTVLLEAQELILRGAVKAKLSLAELSNLQVRADGLHASTPRGALWLGMSERVAHSWLGKIQTPAPSLAKKLGIGAGTSVALLFPDQELESLVHATEGVICIPAHAKLWIAALSSSADLSDLLAQLQRMPVAQGQALWVIRVKGKEALLKESTVMSELRALGLVPTKTARVSETRTADRYTRSS